jgi:hypothetical protein
VPETDAHKVLISCEEGDGVIRGHCAMGQTYSKEAIRFREAVLEAVDEGLLVFGESTRHIVYYMLERDSSVTRDEIPEKLDDFIAELENILWVGAKVVEKVISEKLCTKLGLTFLEHESWTPADYADKAKKHVKATEV